MTNKNFNHLSLWWRYLRFSERGSFSAWVRMLVCIVLSCSSLWAQEGAHVIKGVVRTQEDRLAGASVAVYSLPDSSLLAYTYTDAQGAFALKVNAQQRQGLVTVRCMGHKPHSQRLTLTDQTLDIHLEEERQILREVIVQAPTVWGSRDTINYSVAQLARVGDRHIGDVIRRIPGIRIQGNQIEYQGKPLKQIHVEGVDLGQGDYGLIANHIDARDISTIQVLDNYQGIKSLVGKRSSDDVVINLKLSPKKRGVWGASLDLGLGLGDDGLATNDRIRTSYFSRKAQLLGVAYADNTGRLDYDRWGGVDRRPAQEEPSIFARMEKPVTPNLPSSYYTDNVSWQAEGHSAVMLRDSSLLQLQGAYRFDRIDSEGSSYSVYDQTPVATILDERITHELRRHNASAGLSYEQNLQSYYLKDRLSVSLTQNDARGNVTLNSSGHPQALELNALRLSNQTHYVNTRWRLPLEFLLTQHLDRLSEDFSTIYGSQLQGILPSQYSGQELKQRGCYTHLQSNNRIQIPQIKLVRYVQYRPQAVLTYQYQNLSSALLDLSGESHDHILRMGMEQTVSYRRERQEVELSLPFSYQLRNTSHDQTRRLLFEPRVKVKLSLSERWGLDLSGRYTSSEPSIKLWYPYAVLRNYRSLTSGNPQLYHEQTATVEGLLNYRDIFAFFSSSLKLNYSSSHKPFVQMLHLGALGGRYELIPHEHDTKTFVSLWSLSKGFTWWSSGIDLDLGYTRYAGTMAYQGTITPYKHQTSSVRLAVKANPRRSILIDYNIYYGNNQVSHAGAYPDTDHLIAQTARLGFTCTKKLFWDVIIEHNYLRSQGERTHTTLLNSELTWQGSFVTLSCELNNLLNVSRYHSQRRLPYASIQQSYDLRPRAMLLKASFKL